MSSSEFDDRMVQVESRLEKAESLLGSVGRALDTIQQGHKTAESRNRVPLVLIAVSAIGVAAFVVVTRRRWSDSDSAQRLPQPATTP
jgi:hypothetical protein